MDFSIIIPACNMQDYVAACLRSITRCSKENIDMECIVVNGGGKDETAAIVRRYMERDNRIRLITKENGGINDARNKGIEESRGRYIMFLDAEDRLCEDAWEHIEAAVEEEYADFVAFSCITLLENGRLKAQMLPLSDVVSTDMQEAKKLMYADSAFHTCQGKIFRSDIVKENHVTFRTDLLTGADFLFAAEYFEHCDSCMMTKAMIFYDLQRSNNLLSSMEERLECIKILYEFSEDAVERCNDIELKKCMQVYYIGVLANLFYEYAKRGRHQKELLEMSYQRALENEVVRTVLNGVDECVLASKRKKHEYRIMKSKNARKIYRYFSLKAKLL